MFLIPERMDLLGSIKINCFSCGTEHKFLKVHNLLPL